MDFDPVGAFMVWISAHGLIGLFAVALAERFVPAMPSYGLLLAVGIAAADGVWSLPAAFVATATGSILGCAATFYAVRGLGGARSTPLLKRARRLFGMSPARIKRWTAIFGGNQMALAFSLQFVPTVRLFVPILAALLRGTSRSFLTASAAGIALCNGLFIGIGYIASRSIETANTTVLALTALGCLLVAEAALFWIAGRVRARRKPDAAVLDRVTPRSGAQPLHPNCVRDHFAMTARIGRPGLDLPAGIGCWAPHAVDRRARAGGIANSGQRYRRGATR